MLDAAGMQICRGFKMHDLITCKSKVPGVVSLGRHWVLFALGRHWFLTNGTWHVPLQSGNVFELGGITINNYWMRLSMISWIIKSDVCVICEAEGWGRYHRHEVLIIHVVMRKPNSIIVLLYIFRIIHPQKQKRSLQSFCFWGEHSKGLSNQADVELDMMNAISASDIAFIMSSLQAIVSWLNVLDQSHFSWWSLLYNNMWYRCW